MKFVSIYPKKYFLKKLKKKREKYLVENWDNIMAIGDNCSLRNSQWRADVVTVTFLGLHYLNFGVENGQLDGALVPYMGP